MSGNKQNHLTTGSFGPGCWWLMWRSDWTTAPHPNSVSVWSRVLSTKNTRVCLGQWSTVGSFQLVWDVTHIVMWAVIKDCWVRLLLCGPDLVLTSSVMTPPVRHLRGLRPPPQWAATLGPVYSRQLSQAGSWAERSREGRAILAAAAQSPGDGVVERGWPTPASVDCRSVRTPAGSGCYSTLANREVSSSNGSAESWWRPEQTGSHTESSSNCPHLDSNSSTCMILVLFLVPGTSCCSRNTYSH